MALFINDITFFNIIIGAGYLFLALLCCFYAIRSKGITYPDRVMAERILWWSIAAILILLSIYKILNLQYLISEAGRAVAKAGGWHRQRYFFQIFFIASTGIVSLIILSVVEFATPDIWRIHWLLICGIICLICYSIINVISYHPVDQILNHKIGRVSIKWAFELGNMIWIGIALIFNFNRFAQRPSVQETTSSNRYI